MYADSGNLSRQLILYPYARQPGNSLRRHTKIAAGADQHLFQLAHKIHRAHTWREGAQITYRIADQLPRTVKRHVAAAIRLMQLNAVVCQKLTRSNNVLRAGIAPHGDYRRMLQKQQRMRNAPFFDQLHQGLLQLQRNGVIHAAEIQDIDNSLLHTLILSDESRSSS
jgi:hypothetical protein